jgi:hypothetical protein
MRRPTRTVTYLQRIISSTLYNKGYENTKEMYEKTFFSGFWVIALIDQKKVKNVVSCNTG